MQCSLKHWTQWHLVNRESLARNVADYKSHLADCDMRRRNDLDGRGNLSEEALGRFTEFFLTTCIDQVSLMEEIGATEPATLSHPHVGRGRNPCG